MAAPVAKPLSRGVIRGVIYDFASVGDVLPLHDHTAENAHISIVAKGAFKISGNGWSQTNVAGDVLDFEAGNPHEFEAIEPASRVVNIIKAPAT
jgi:quercetin dioxygenase-like cupin family protein